MTKKHKFLYALWRVYIFLIGIRKGTIVKIHNAEEHRYIFGVIDAFCGDSISQKSYKFGIDIHLFEPFQGHDWSVYRSGVYFVSDFKTKRVKIV